MKKIIKFIFAISISLMAISAKAQDVIIQGEPFVPKKDVVFEFTPKESGILVVQTNTYAYYGWLPTGTWSFLFNDYECTSPVKCTNYSETENPQSTKYMFKGIEGGKTYYFMEGQYNLVEFTFTMDTSDEAFTEGVLNVTPTTDEPINYVTTSEIHIECTSGVQSFGEVSIAYGDKVQVLDPHVYYIFINGPSLKRFLQIGGTNGAPAFKQLMLDILAAGEHSFTVTVNDLKAGTSADNAMLVTTDDTGMEGVTVDNGTVTLQYELLEAPQYLPMQSRWPNPFYNYWDEGDPNAVATLEFSMDIASVEEVTVIMGPVSANSDVNDAIYAYYDVPAEKIKVEGKSVKIDFSGEYRVGNAGKVTVTVQNVKGTNGMPVDLGEWGRQLTMFEVLNYSNISAPSTGVGELQSDPGSSEIYNLQGLKMENTNLAPGIYIKEGKKIVILR